MNELQTGLWQWEAPHPDWTEEAGGWGPDVTCYAIDDGARLLLIDPLALPSELEQLAGARETVIVLTCAWHERDARSLAKRLGAATFVPAPEEGEPIEGRLLYSAGDRLPVGVEAFPGREPNDVVVWIASRRALVAGDTLIDRGNGLELPTDWLPSDVTREEILATLRPLLELPVEVVLPTHGEPTDRAALERALSG
jgi:glyoxylase-like metal-dependent hydrolase (beta-lactamase superfamily II)